MLYAITIGTACIEVIVDAAAVDDYSNNDVIAPIKAVTLISW